MILNVKVITNASKQEIKRDNDSLKVYLNSSPEKGRANKELINLLASYYRVSKNCIRILKGEKGRKKVVEVDI
ncbi:MAG: DUF167 domain-containing protein [Candidatus Portnoybacteria bacterium]|nr:DUF167 domain-containing protein [Candidatus Portnoybacteria bacterium]